MCSRSGACGCPFGLELRHAPGAPSVDVWQTQTHQFHDPASLEDLALLKMDPEVEAQCRLLLLGGVLPHRVCHLLNEQSAERNCGSLEAAADGRYSIVPAQVYAVRKKMQREAGFG